MTNIPRKFAPIRWFDNYTTLEYWRCQSTTPRNYDFRYRYTRTRQLVGDPAFKPALSEAVIKDGGSSAGVGGVVESLNCTLLRFPTAFAASDN
jgi:hypothetical protein